MSQILVHGVPDTDHVWHRVRPLLQRDDVVTLRLPGFGAPLPSGFDPTKDGYAVWVVERVAAVGHPVDLVGHDWGALLVLRAASLRPDLVRSWVVGGAPLDPAYVWHQAVQVWQTPGAGERAMERTNADVLAKALAAAGVPADDAAHASSSSPAPRTGGHSSGPSRSPPRSGGTSPAYLPCNCAASASAASWPHAVALGTSVRRLP
jgi:pimeloyl-ACP methyl ester carboxylesterase